MNEHAALFRRSGGIPLGQASFGDAPMLVRDYANTIRDKIGDDGQSYFWEEEAGLFEAARQRAAEFVSADANRFVLTLNSATAWTSVLHSLERQVNKGELDLGNKVLITNHIYGPFRAAIDDFVKTNGLELLIVKVPFPCNSEKEVVAAFEEALNSVEPEEVRFAITDHIPSFPSFVYPLKEILDLLKSRDIISLVDGTHVPGQLPLNLKELDADFYIAGFSKWSYVPTSVSGLHVSDRWADKLYPAVKSTACASEDMVERFKWTGTHDRTAAICLPFAIDYIAGLFPNGWDDVYEQNHETLMWGAKHICSELGVGMPCPDHMIGSLITIPIGKFEFEPEVNELAPHLRLRSKLKDHGIDTISAIDADGTHYLRLTARVYNSREDYQSLAKALKGIVAQYGVKPGGPGNVPPQ